MSALQLHSKISTPAGIESNNARAVSVASSPNNFIVLRNSAAKTAQAIQLEALGQRTASVAHDFNNLLTIIISALDTLADDLEPGSRDQELALVSLRAAECGADLVARLLDGSDDQAAAPRLLDGAHVVAAMKPLAAELVGEDVALAISAPAYPLPCLADEAQLQSALLNLCSNARDAMPHGGAIALSASSKRLNGDQAARLGLRPGAYVVFTVSDTGVGMSAETARRATEPFFTTKGAAGTGLGLSNVSEFARKAGGRLTISSRINRGTTAEFYLPLAQADHAPVHAQARVGRQTHLICLQPERKPS